jgi:hypothetical protein
MIRYRGCIFLALYAGLGCSLYVLNTRSYPQSETSGVFDLAALLDIIFGEERRTEARRKG